MGEELQKPVTAAINNKSIEEAAAEVARIKAEMPDIVAEIHTLYQKHKALLNQKIEEFHQIKLEDSSVEGYERYWEKLEKNRQEQATMMDEYNQCWSFDGAPNKNCKKSFLWSRG